MILIKSRAAEAPWRRLELDHLFICSIQCSNLWRCRSKTCRFQRDGGMAVCHWLDAFCNGLAHQRLRARKFVYAGLAERKRILQGNEDEAMDVANI